MFKKIKQKYAQLPQRTTRGLAAVLLVVPIVTFALIGASRDGIGNAQVAASQMQIGAVTSNSIVVNWGSHPYTTSYYVSRTNPNTNVAVGASVRTYTWTGLACGTTYVLSVAAQESTSAPSGGGVQPMFNAPLSATTSACPTPPPAPTPTPTPTPTPKPTPKPTTSTPPLQGSVNTPAPAAPAADTTPPSAPEGFSAAPDDKNAHINVYWLPASDNVGTDHYTLERSLDNATWSAVGEEIDGLSYLDKDTKYKTRYYYRLTAIDTSGNKSPSVTTEVTSSEFRSNVTSAEGGTISADDISGLKVTFPSGAISKDLYCEITTADADIAKFTVDKYQLLDGPFTVICQDADGNKVTSFDKPLTVETAPSAEQQKRFTDFRYYADKESGLTLVHNGAGDFLLDDANSFALFAKPKTTPVWVKLLLILLVIGLIIFGILLFLRKRYRQQQEAALEDYLHKMKGY